MSRPLVLVLQIAALWMIVAGYASSNWSQLAIGCGIGVLSVAGRKKAGR